MDIRAWLDQSIQDIEIPEGAAGIAVVRALAQWTLDFSADGNNQGFPFDLPYLDLYVRCLHIRWAVAGFLRKEPADAKVKKFLARLQKILAPMDCDVPPFAQVAQDLDKRANIFAELRTALRLVPNSTGWSDGAAAPADALQTANEFEDIHAAVAKLSARLKQRRSERGSAKDIMQAIDIVLTHLDRHGPFLWGHAITTNEETGRVLLVVDRTNNILEGFFHGMKHGERRRSGRKILTQDFYGVKSRLDLDSRLMGLKPKSAWRPFGSTDPAHRIPDTMRITTVLTEPIKASFPDRSLQNQEISRTPDR